MNFIDLIILIPVVWFTYKGFTKGLIIELATLIALLLGIYLASRFSDLTADFLKEKMDIKNQYLNIISFAITFIGVVILIMLFGKALEKVISAMLLSFVNKLAGAAFGLLKVVFVISVFILILGKFEVEEKMISPKLQDDSLLYKPVKKLAPAVFPFLIAQKEKILKEV